jgi:hypothetical protein
MSFLGKALVGLGLKSDNRDKTVTSKRVMTRSTKTTSEASVQVGVLGLKAEQRTQRRYERMIAELRRLRARVQPRDETSQSTSRLASESEDYHIGKVISKLLKQEKKAATSANETHTCSVCLEELSTANTNMTKTNCGHVFHLSCLLKSLTTKNKCPMCRSDLEDPRPVPPVSNLLTPASAEQLIVEEISYFPNASHTQSITLSRHPKRRVKEMLRVFGFALLRATAQFVHDENMPEGWYDDSESTDSDDDDETENEEENQEEPDGYSSDNTAVAGDEWRPLPPQNQDLRFSLDEVHQAAFNAFR